MGPSMQLRFDLFMYMASYMGGVLPENMEGLLRAGHDFKWQKAEKNKSTWCRLLNSGVRNPVSFTWLSQVYVLRN